MPLTEYILTVCREPAAHEAKAVPTTGAPLPRPTLKAHAPAAPTITRKPAAHAPAPAPKVHRKPAAYAPGPAPRIHRKAAALAPAPAPKNPHKAAAGAAPAPGPKPHPKAAAHAPGPAPKLHPKAAAFAPAPLPLSPAITAAPKGPTAPPLLAPPTPLPTPAAPLYAVCKRLAVLTTASTGPLLVRAPPHHCAAYDTWDRQTSCMRYPAALPEYMALSFR